MRLALPNPAGPRTRLSFPLTWGGDKRAGTEFEKTFEDAPVTRVLAGAAISRRTNPYFQEDDDRKGVWARAEREIVHSVRVGATVAWDQACPFVARTKRLRAAGADVVLDTRLDTVLPQKRRLRARRVGSSSSRIPEPCARNSRPAATSGSFARTPRRAAYLRDDSNVPLPPYLQPMLGGMDTVRGFKAGTAIGDTLMSRRPRKSSFR